MRLIMQLTPLVVSLFLAAAVFVIIETYSMGWFAFEAVPSQVTSMERIDDEALSLGYRTGVLNAWVHSIAPGQVVDFHQHPTRAEMVVVLRGRATVRGLRKGARRGEPLVRTEVVGQGDMVFSPATSVHEYSNATSAPLWCLVIMSPPVLSNVYLDGDAPNSDHDFLYVSLGDSPRAAGVVVPQWAKVLAGSDVSDIEDRDEIADRNVPAIDFFRGIEVRYHGKTRGIESEIDAAQSWLVLTDGEAVLADGSSQVRVSAPTFVQVGSGGWTLTTANGQFSVIEFALPVFDGRMFTLAMIERYASPGIAQWLPGILGLHATHEWFAPTQ